MSDDLGIIIKLSDYTVYICYGDCKPDKLGKYRSLEEAVKFAEKYIKEELDGFCEYGIRFI